MCSKALLFRGAFRYCIRSITWIDFVDYFQTIFEVRNYMDIVMMCAQ